MYTIDSLELQALGYNPRKMLIKGPQPIWSFSSSLTDWYKLLLNVDSSSMQKIPNQGQWLQSKGSTVYYIDFQNCFP